MSEMTTITVPTSFGDVPLTVDDRGAGRTIVLLHGGAGPASVTGFADMLAEAVGARVVVPTHPGFGGTPRPDALTTVVGLAELYESLLGALDAQDAVVIGNSLGGWITAELAIRRPARLGRIALVDAVGIEVDGHSAAGAIPPAELIARSWYDPLKAPGIDPSTMPPAAQRIFAGNRAALALYGGTMADPTLVPRLGEVDVPALVVWGEADRIADADYGRAFAAAIPDARFVVLPETGHVPQLETPETLLAAIRDFVAS